jgi:cytochrome c553
MLTAGCLSGWSFVAMVFLILSGGSNVARADAPVKRADAPSVEAAEFFESRIRPILVEKCVSCHGPKKQSSGLRLDSREGVLKGGDSGPAALPSRPEESLIIQAVAHRHEELKMPPKGKLPDAEVAMLSQWVAMGVPWPAGPGKTMAAAGADPAAEHWAFRPIRSAVPPVLKDRDSAATPLDAFILARLEAKGIAPSPPADRRTLIRRATMDLWGLPPTPEEVAAFEADDAPDAYARLVDRLLASPRYGERWGRHWLDVARYADTKGYVFTQERRYPYSFTYRDYVIAALNADLPYDRFVVEQIAADQLATGQGAEKDTRPLAAMGFLTVGRRFLLDQNEIIDDRIDVVCRGLLGLTVTCARCHDHKFDPIPTDDYYSLYGVFASSVEPDDLPVLEWPGSGAEKSAEFARKLGAAKKELDDYLAARRDEIHKDFAERFSRYLKAAYDLKLDARNAKVDERALADKLDARRLRGVMTLWRRHLEATATTNDPVLAPWHAFAALPRERFAAQAEGVRRRLLSADLKTDPKAKPVHPLVARTVLATAPAGMDEVVGRYVALFGQLEARQKEPAVQAAKVLPEPEWESLRLALHGPNGPLTIADIGDPRRLLLNQRQRQELEQLKGAIDRLNATEPSAPARAMVMRDAPQPVEPHVFVRGNPGRPGKAVPRRFLRVVAGEKAAPFQKGSGRLELARAIADPKNPLTARVLVNRVWHWHFGKGLVTTPSDFGLRSDPPSHPELLDLLAAGFMADGWSIKALHRRIMLSGAYRQASAPRPDAAERDPENNLLWRFNPQRLDFESMRDSILAVAGALDPVVGGRPVAITEAPFAPRRTVYGFIDRQNLDGLYRTFDFAVPDATSPRRFVTTVPQQALFLMNSPFLHEQARRLTATVRPDESSDPTGGIQRLYRRVLLRAPEPGELAMAEEFLRRQSGPAAPPDGWKRFVPSKEGASLSPWEQLAQVLMLTNEFMFEE